MMRIAVRFNSDMRHCEHPAIYQAWSRRQQLTVSVEPFTAIGRPGLGTPFRIGGRPKPVQGRKSQRDSGGRNPRE
jgi:hypothetical protein